MLKTCNATKSVSRRRAIVVCSFIQRLNTHEVFEMAAKLRKILCYCNLYANN